jgi:hypothetical protein
MGTVNTVQLTRRCGYIAAPSAAALSFLFALTITPIQSDTMARRAEKAENNLELKPLAVSGSSQVFALPLVLSRYFSMQCMNLRRLETIQPAF